MGIPQSLLNGLTRLVFVFIRCHSAPGLAVIAPRLSQLL
jgi:hypothetical protein